MQPIEKTAFRAGEESSKHNGDYTSPPSDLMLSANAFSLSAFLARTATR